MFRHSFVNVRIFFFRDLVDDTFFSSYRNKFRVILFTTVSLRSVLIWSAKISISDTFYSFYFRKGKKAAEAHKEICEVYGVNCLIERTCRNLF